MIPENTEPLPVPLLKSILETIEKARAFVRERRKDSPLHYKLREASFTTRQMLDLAQQENPNWYELYDGLVGLYVQQKADLLRLKEDNTRLRREDAELKERYFDAMKRLEEHESWWANWYEKPKADNTSTVTAIELATPPA